jgi:hypothetical protein
MDMNAKHVIQTLRGYALTLFWAYFLCLGVERFIEIHPRISNAVVSVVPTALPIVVTALFLFYGTLAVRGFRDGMRESREHAAKQ